MLNDQQLSAEIGDYLRHPTKKVLVIFGESEEIYIKKLIQQSLLPEMTLIAVNLTEQAALVASLCYLPTNRSAGLVITGCNKKNIRKNIYATYTLDQWQAKVIILCPHHLLPPGADLSLYFAPIKNGRVQRSLLSIIKITLQPALNISSSPNEHEITLKNKTMDTNENWCNHFLNVALISHDSVLIDALASRALESHNFRVDLFNIVYASRYNKKLHYAAANAMTILNSANIPFSNLMLANAYIAGAVLTCAILDGTILSSTDLSNVELQKSYLGNCCLENTDLSNCQFGELPSFNNHSHSVSWISVINNEQIVSSSLDGTVKLINLTSGTVNVLSCWNNRAILIHQVSFDQRYLATSDTQGKIYINPLDDRTNGYMLVDAKNRISSICFINDEQLAVGGSDGHIAIWDFKRKEIYKVLIGHTKRITGLLFIKSKNILISASIDTTICIWSIDHCNKLETIQTPSQIIASIDINFFSNMLASGGHDKLIHLWKISQSVTHLKTLKGHEDIVTVVCFGLEGLLYSGSVDKTIRCWKCDDGSCLMIIGYHPDMVTTLRVSVDDKYIISGCYDGVVRFWENPKAKKLLRYKSIGHNGSVICLCFNNSGNLLATGAWDNTVYIWSVETGLILNKLSAHVDMVTCLKFDNDDTYLASGGKDSLIVVWDLVTVKPAQTLKGHTDKVTGLFFILRTSKLVSTSWDKTIRIWDWKKNETVKILDDHSEKILVLLSSPTLDWYITCDDGGIIKIWQTKQHKIQYSIVAHKGTVTSIEYMARQKLIVTGGCDGLVKIWSLENGSLVHQCHFASMINHIKLISEDDNMIAVASEKNVYIYSVVKGTVYKLSGHLSTITAMCIDKKGKYLVTGGGNEDKTVKIWEIHSGKETQNIKVFDSLITALSINDKDDLAVASLDYSIALWTFQKNISRTETSRHFLKWTSRHKLFCEEANFNGSLGIAKSDSLLLEQKGANINRASLF
jgi:WD40 repeat protein